MISTIHLIASNRFSIFVLHVCQKSIITLNHCDGVTYIYASLYWVIIGSFKGIYAILSINFVKLSTKYNICTRTKVHLKITFAKLEPFYFTLNYTHNLIAAGIHIWDLTHWGRNKMDAIFQTTSWNAFSWMKIYKFRLRFHWSLFPRVHLTLFQHWFR